MAAVRTYVFIRRPPRSPAITVSPAVSIHQPPVAIHQISIEHISIAGPCDGVSILSWPVVPVCRG